MGVIHGAGSGGGGDGDGATTTVTRTVLVGALSMLMGTGSELNHSLSIVLVGVVAIVLDMPFASLDVAEGCRMSRVASPTLLRRRRRLASSRRCTVEHLTLTDSVEAENLESIASPKSSVGKVLQLPATSKFAVTT